jgi:Tfp pilus assembly protein PilN
MGQLNPSPVTERMRGLARSWEVRLSTNTMLPQQQHLLQENLVALKAVLSELEAAERRQGILKKTIQRFSSLRRQRRLDERALKNLEDALHEVL